MVLLDGKALSKQIRQEIAQKVKQYTDKGLRPPNLAVIMVGNDPASATYVRNKMKACKEVGFTAAEFKFSDDVTQQHLLKVINDLNHEPVIDGFIVQLPLPKHLDPQRIIEAISPDKDIDGFHPVNIGKTLLGLDGFRPATPKGIIEMLKRYNISPQGKHTVIVGRSNIVGKPLAAMLIQKDRWANATVTVCHSQTPDLAYHTRQADILVAAIGRPKFITKQMVKQGAVVIDVGINAIEDKTKKSGYRLVGDVDFENVAPVASYITPVPGGVGPMTVTALLLNTLEAYEKFYLPTAG